MLGYPEPLRVLLEALDGVDRLVLLGDLAELVTRNPRRSLAAAEPVLRALGQRMGTEREVIVVPGNHDFPLVRAWARARGAELSIDDAVEPDATGALARVVSWLGPSPVRVHYPGVWLEEGIYATHGHYLDQHLWPESAIGLAWGGLRRPPRDSVEPIDYESGGRPSFSRVTGWVPRPIAALLDDLAELLRASTMPLVKRRLLNPRVAPLTAALLGLQMRRSSIPALARVAQRLGVEAEWVLFGHVHRLGPPAGGRLPDRAARHGALAGARLRLRGAGRVPVPHPGRGVAAGHVAG